MSNETTAKPKARNTVAIDQALGAELSEIAPKVGADNVAALTRMGLRYVFAKIRSGELVNINGQLVPNPEHPASATERRRHAKAA